MCPGVESTLRPVRPTRPEVRRLQDVGFAAPADDSNGGQPKVQPDSAVAALQQPEHGCNTQGMVGLPRRHPSEPEEPEPLSEDRKSLIQRYMVDAQEAERRGLETRNETSEVAAPAHAPTPPVERTVVPEPAPPPASALPHQTTEPAEEAPTPIARTPRKRTPRPKPAPTTRPRAAGQTKRRPTTTPSSRARTPRLVEEPEPRDAASHSGASSFDAHEIASAAQFDACTITRWRGYFSCEFCALRIPDGEVVATSGSFRWTKSDPPPDAGAAREAFDRLVAQLQANGWSERSGGLLWYERRFERPSDFPPPENEIASRLQPLD